MKENKAAADQKPAAKKKAKKKPEAEKKTAPDLVWGRKPVYSAAELSAMLGVSIPKVNAFMRLGWLPYIEIGHRVVRHEDLAEFLKNNVGKDISKAEKLLEELEKGLTA